MLPISEQYLQSPCEMKSMDNVPILMGYLRNVFTDGIEISGATDKLPVIHANTTVRVSVFNNMLGFRVMVGKVYLSTPELIRLVEVQNEDDYEKRNFFRVKVDFKAEAYVVRGEENESSSPKNIFPIQVRDLSLGGIYFTSETPLKADDRVVINLDLFDTSVSIICKIVRKMEVQHVFKDGYGCEFLDNSGRQFDLLCKYLFDRQREQIRMMKQIHS